MQDFSLALYQDLATAAIAEIAARGHLPLLVGGTGQYLAALLEGWQIPRVAPQPELRAALERAGRRSMARRRCTRGWRWSTQLLRLASCRPMSAA